MKAHTHVFAAGLSVLTAFALSSCGDKENAGNEASEERAKKEEHKAIVTEKLEPYECGTITRLHTLGGVFLASQPKPEDFEQAKKGGVKTVINLRHHEEIADFNERRSSRGST